MIFRNRFLLFFSFLVLKNIGFTQSSLIKECPAEWREDLLNRKRGEPFGITKSCILNLKEEDVIHTDIIIKGASTSNFKLDCHKATIGTEEKPITVFIQSLKIQSSDGEFSWSRPENINIQNCKIHGRIRVMGFGRNGEAEEVLKSSLSKGHTERAQNAAPKNITIQNCEIISKVGVVIYFSPGVTYSSILDSKIKGSSGKGPGIYLDAESAFNTIARNFVAAESIREQIAIDGSANNLIQENYIYNLNKGGINIYRNCGEGGTIRHQEPSNNQIINNFFFYKNYTGDTPAIFIGSRNGNRNYCDEDEHEGQYKFGSSIDNLDHAHDTLVKGNLFFNRDPNRYIRIGYKKTDSATITDNKTVDEIPKTLALSGNSTTSIPAPAPATTPPNIPPSKPPSAPTATPSVATPPATTAPAPAPKQTEVLSFGCKIQSNNKGCSGTLPVCPVNMKPMKIKAACNLEYGNVTTIDKLEWNKIKVDKASDNISDGECRLGKTSLSSGEKNISLTSSNNFSCREHDKNGGDCHILGKILCESI